MRNPTKLPTKPDPAPGVAPDTDAHRRRLLQGGLAAAPVLMTLFSRPVLGQPVPCQTQSAFLSGNASSPGQENLPVCQDPMAPPVVPPP